MSHSGEARGSYVDPLAIYPLMQSYTLPQCLGPTIQKIFVLPDIRKRSPGVQSAFAYGKAFR